MVAKTPRKKPEPKAYSVWAKFNGMEFRKRTNDLQQAILDLKPDILHTEMYLIAKKGKESSERQLNLKQGKKLFNDDMFREVFINNLLLN